MIGWAIPISFEQPYWLLLLLAIPALVGVSLRTLNSLERARRIQAIAMRSLLLVLFACVLAKIHYVKRSDSLAVFFLLDRSRSVPESVRTQSEEYVRRSARQAELNDKIAVIGFDGDISIDMPPSTVGGDLYPFGSAMQPDRTDVARALRTALAIAPEGYGRRIVIASDMNENIGSVMVEAETAAANGAVIDILPQRFNYDNEILIDRLVTPAQAQPETSIPLRLIARSRKDAKVRLLLFDNGQPIKLPTDIIELEGGMRPQAIKLDYYLPKSTQIHNFEARIEPLDAASDTLAPNNAATAVTVVEGKGQILIVTQVEGDESGLRDHAAFLQKLQEENIDVVMKTPDEIVWDNPMALDAYSAIVLANVSADQFTEEGKKALAGYVRDSGGGLILTGGNRSFGAGGWIGSPIEEISPVSFEIKHKKVIPKGALAIILHSCEIPQGNYWGEQVAIASVNTISSQDHLGILAYTWNPGGINWQVPMQAAYDKPAIIGKIRKQQIGDMPDFGPAMDEAIDKLLKVPGASQRHMIIISDGDPSPPSQQTVRRMVDNRITCSTVTIGYGGHVINEQLMKDLARMTGGQFYPCRNPKTLPQIFVKEAQTVRRSLIDQSTFTPQLAYTMAQTTRGFVAGDFPQLDGLVLTSPKPQSIEMPLVRAGTDGTDPVMAQWQYELGKVVVFTSGWWPQWGQRWTQWERFGAFWAQVLRWAMRQPTSDDFDVTTRLEGDRGHVIIEALGQDASYLNQLSIAGVLIKPDQSREPIRLTQTGPGRYETNFDVRDNGPYRVTLRCGGVAKAAGAATPLIRTGLTVPYSPEYRELSANTGLMESVRAKTGGRILTMDPKTDDVFHHQRPRVESRQPIWRWVITWLLLPLFLLDVASRRLASPLAMSIYVEAVVLAVCVGLLSSLYSPWWGYVLAVVLAEVVGWTIRRHAILPTIHYFTHTVRTLGRTGQASAESLSQLKTVRDRVRDQRGGHPAATATGETAVGGSIPLEPAPDRRARFDVGDQRATKKAGDLTESLGGASKTEKVPGAAKESSEGQRPGAADRTSRLFKAKRRAQQELESKKEEQDKKE